MDLTPIANVTAADAARASNGAGRPRPAVPGRAFGVALDAALHRREPAGPASSKDAPVREAERDDEPDPAEQNMAAFLAARREVRNAKPPAPIRRDTTDAAGGAAATDEGGAAREAAAAAGTTGAPETVAAAGAGGTREARATGEAGGVRGRRAAAAVAADDSDVAAPAETPTPETDGVKATGSTNAGPTDGPEAAAKTKEAASPDRPAGPSDVRSIDRSLESLSPAFRERLGRVIERLEAEGHEVTVLETYRDPARQDYLFAQGRTRPGPVVTWTRDSNHSDGRAADLLIDGSYDNPQGYARLARIAAEEGLRTLGARDPGHLELAAAGDGATTTSSFTSAGAGAMDGLFGGARMARVAEVAQVAQVGHAARVADVAAVATPASAAHVARVASVAHPGSAAAAMPLAEATRVAAAGTDAGVPGAAGRASTHAALAPSADAAERAARLAVDASVLESIGTRSGEADGESPVMTPVSAARFASLERMAGARLEEVVRGASGSNQTSVGNGSADRSGAVRPIVTEPVPGSDVAARGAVNATSGSAALRGSPEAVAAAAAAVPAELLASALAAARGIVRARPQRSADPEATPSAALPAPDAAAGDGAAAEPTARAESPTATAEPVQRVERSAWVAEPTASRTATAASGIAATERPDVAGRAERVAALQDAAAAQPLSHVTVRLDGEGGTDARIRVGLRGSTVGASIDAADPATAASLRAHVAELREALTRQGLDPASLTVRATARAAEPADIARLVTNLAAGESTATLTAARESSSQREAGQHQSHSTPRRDAEAQRQRQDRQNKEERK